MRILRLPLYIIGKYSQPRPGKSQQLNSTEIGKPVQSQMGIANAAYSAVMRSHHVSAPSLIFALVAVFLSGVFPTVARRKACGNARRNG